MTKSFGCIWMRRYTLKLQDLERIEYRRGIIDAGMGPSDVPVKTWRGAGISADIRKSINKENILALGGVYGDKDAGDPIEYDHLRLVLTDDVVEIEVFNDILEPGREADHPRVGCPRVSPSGPECREGLGQRHHDHLKPGALPLVDPLAGRRILPAARA